MTITTDSCDERESLMAIIRDIKANRVLLAELMDGYGVFFVMGGAISQKALSLETMNSYRQCPFEDDRISTAAIDRYRRVAQTIMDLGRAISPQSRPRTLRLRNEITERFGRYFSEIRALGNALESAMTILVEETKPLLSRP